MKYVLLMLPILAISGTYWTPRSAVMSGFSVEHICKEGVQVVRFTKNKQVFEQPYCYNQSSWDSDCLHEPIRCYSEDKKDTK